MLDIWVKIMCFGCTYQIPVAVGVSGYEAVCLYKGKRVIASKGEEGTNWKVHQLVLYCFCGVAAGVVGGLLGLGGGFILGPLFLELGIPPQVNHTDSFHLMRLWTFRISLKSEHCLNIARIILGKNMDLKICALGLDEITTYWYTVIKITVLILLEHSVQVSSATATFAMTFSSSMSVVEYYLLKRFPVPYGKYYPLSGNFSWFLSLSLSTLLQSSFLW